MNYTINKNINTDFDTAVDKTIDALKSEGFGVLSDIDIHEKFKEKLDVDFRRYKILGACNPPLAYEALQKEPSIGTMLPCNVTIQEIDKNTIRIDAIDPVVSMIGVENKALTDSAEVVKKKLINVVNSI